MVFKVESQGHKFKISFSGGIGRGHSIYASNKEEVINSLKHYLSMKHNEKKCPSCEHGK